MKIKQRILTPFKGLGLLLIALFVGASAWAQSGTEGNIFWSIDDSTLTISGAGAIPDFTTNNLPGWYDYRDSFTKVVVGDSVTTIGSYAFYNCVKSRSVTIPNSVAIIGSGAFGSCSGLTSVTIPNSVTGIGNFTFSQCSSLTSASIGNSVTSIGSMAFSSCPNLTSVTIPYSVTTLGNNAFYGCSGLTSITVLKPNLLTVDATIFANVNQSACTLTVPASAVAAYRVATIWKDFIVADGGLLVAATVNDSKYGSISGSGLYTSNATASLTATANEGYRFVNWTKDGVEVSNSAAYSFTVTTDVVLKANFEKLLFGTEGPLTWSIIDSTLTISGTGAMPDYISAKLPGWCDYKSFFTKVVIEDGVTTIGNYAFNGCTKISSITIPNSVTTIGSSSFFGCSGLTSITIPDSVTAIGNKAFNTCSGLTSVTIPGSVTTIGSDAFFGCDGLTSITVDAANTAYVSVDGILYNKALTTLEQCPGGKTGAVVIPNSVTAIRNEAFQDCRGLTSVTISNSVTSIEENIFSGCSSLTSMILPNSVTAIGPLAFLGCSGLTSVTIPNSVTTIGIMVFYACSSLNSITASNPNPIVIDAAVFTGVDQSACTLTVPTSAVAAYEAADVWKNFNIVGGGWLVTATANDSKYGSTSGGGLYASNATASLTATANEGYRFINWTKDGVEVSDSAAYSFTTTTDVVLKANFEDISNKPVTGTAGPLTWSIYNGTLTISGAGAMPDYTTENFPGWYDYRNSLTKVVIGDSVTTIGDYAFFGQDHINSATIGNSVTTIGQSSFRDCSSLASVTIGNSVTSIGDAAFSGCSGLTSITIPNSVKSIGYVAFWGCLSLTSITIPGSVTSIGSTVFIGCIGLTSIIVDAANTIYVSVDGILYSELHDETQAFVLEQCPAGKTGAITIPNSVTDIRNGAFQGCNGLTSITSLNPKPVKIIDTTVFVGVDQSACTLIVPTSAVEDYKAANEWKDFTIVGGGLLAAATVNDSKYGTTSGSGLYANDAAVSLTATAKEGYRFVNWTNAAGTEVSTANPYSFKVTEDTELTANFQAMPAGINDVADDGFAVYPNPTTGKLTIENGQLKIGKVELFDMQGKKLSTFNAQLSTLDIELGGYAAGVYLLEVNGKMHKVMKK